MIAARRCLLMASLVIVSGAVAGCTASGQWHLSKLLFPNEGHHLEDESVPTWVEDAGAEGRAGRTVEKDSDPTWLRDVLVSPRAQSIEKSLGIE